MVPYNLREFAPVVRGIARTQARIEVRQNGYLIQSQTVAPGAFALTDLPVTGSGSDLQVTVLESDGTAQVLRCRSPRRPLRCVRGTLKYNVTAGQYRSSDDAVEHTSLGQVTAMYGLPWGLTVYGGLQGGGALPVCGSGAWLVTGASGGGVAGHDALPGQQKGHDYETGDTWRIRYNKSFELTGTSFTAASYQYSSDGYHTLAGRAGHLA